MSLDNAPSRKEKKAQRDAQRHNKGRKRKHGEVADEDSAHHDPPTSQATPTKDELLPESDILDAAGPNDDFREENEDGLAPNQTSSDAAAGRSKRRRKTKPAHSAQPRFIVFIGNLPYMTTDASLQAHFQKLAPFTLRHRTDPQTKKSKGFAFLEFDNYDRMKTCLKLYHSSVFDPEGKTTGAAGKEGSRKESGRRINVELTAGGGGKTQARREKIKAKNVRLEEQRKRRAKAERQQKAEKEKTHTPKTEKPTKKAALPLETSDRVLGDDEGIHPSRRARMTA